jgi:hypothetical protein
MRERDVMSGLLIVAESTMDFAQSKRYEVG